MNYWSEAVQHAVTQMRNFIIIAVIYVLYSHTRAPDFKNTAMKNECNVLHINHIVSGHILTTIHRTEKKILRNTYRDAAVVFFSFIFLICIMKPTSILKRNPVIKHIFFVNLVKT